MAYIPSSFKLKGQRETKVKQIGCDWVDDEYDLDGTIEKKNTRQIQIFYLIKLTNCIDNNKIQ